MPEVTVQIGGRDFTVACQDGEEPFLQSAASMLNEEASALVDQIGRLPEARMLLMAGLMLADRTAAAEEKVQEIEDKLSKQEGLLAEIEARPAPQAPESDLSRLAEIAEVAEALASKVEEKAAG